MFYPDVQQTRPYLDDPDVHMASHSSGSDLLESY